MRVPTSEVFNEDCMPLMSRYPDKYFDLAIVDPPYFVGPNLTGYYGRGYSSLGVKRARHYGQLLNWSVPDRKYFDELQRVSKHQIIWGANHFAGVFDSSSSCWIVWDKENGASSFADAELAYTSFKTSVRIFKYMWNGMHQGSYGGNVKLNEKRIHPTQKPTALYRWLLANYGMGGGKILDTHLGSGSSRIAAYDMGFDFVGAEIDEEFYRKQEKRFQQHIAQLKIF